MHAAAINSVEICKLLLRLGAGCSINYSCSEYFESALSIADGNKNFALCELLISSGADVATLDPSKSEYLKAIKHTDAAMAKLSISN